MIGHRDSHSPDAALPSLFPKVVCGVDSSPASAEAVRQAATLAGPHGELALVAVGSEHEGALEVAQAVAEEAGLRASAELIHAVRPDAELLDRARSADLLALGGETRSRAGGILLGSLGTIALHSAPGPVLVARPPARPADFPSSVVLASDGGDDAIRAGELTLGIAERWRSRVTVVSVADRHDQAHAHALAAQTAAIFAASESEPVIQSFTGAPRTRIIEAARDAQADLVLMGSRGLGGLRALGSVSEHVAHHVPCSVLVARESTTP